MRKFISQNLSQKRKNKLHLIESWWFSFINNHPSKKLKIIGVTGTKGKTTVCNLIASVLDANGKKNAMITTINTKIDDKITPHATKDRWITTPPASVIHSFLKTAVKAGCEYAIIETSSQALDQNRVFGISYDTVVFTNLGHDHLDYHKTKEEYLKAKLKLFKDNPEAKAIVNYDDANWNRFYSLPAKEKFLYSIEKAVENGVVARKILASPEGSTFTAAYGSGQVTVNLGLPGTFNVQNALAAFLVGLALGLDPEKTKVGLENVDLVAGRMESIKVSKDQNFSVIVDYAHNPDSLKNVYETIRNSLKNTGGRIIAVLGATGRRDKTKRPIMGALAGKFADLVIFTNEDPYDEDPTDIMEEVAEGIFRGASQKNKWRLNRNYWKVIDREQAIKKAIREAQKGDVVIITGKGAEEVMAIGKDDFIPFSDRKIAKEELKKIFKS